VTKGLQLRRPTSTPARWPQSGRVIVAGIIAPSVGGWPNGSSVNALSGPWWGFPSTPDAHAPCWALQGGGCLRFAARAYTVRRVLGSTVPFHARHPCGGVPRGGVRGRRAARFNRAFRTTWRNFPKHTSFLVEEPCDDVRAKKVNVPGPAACSGVFGKPEWHRKMPGSDVY